MSGYIGTQPVPQATQTRDSFTATSGQTTFATGGYTPQFLDVYLNGVKLAATDYTASNGSDVVLASGAATGDILEVVAFTTFTVGSSFTPSIDDNGDATAITIDSSENVLVGMTSASTNNDGAGIRADGLIHGKRAGVVATFNRKTSDGAVIEVAKDNTVVGSVGTQGSRLSIGSGDVNLNFNAPANSMYPISDPAAGTLSSGVVDLGAPLAKFKGVHATTYYGDGSNLTGVGGSTTAGAVGTYAYVAYTYTSPSQNNVDVDWGGTVAGSKIMPAGHAYYYTSGATSSAQSKHGGASTLSGTWRWMGDIQFDHGNRYGVAIAVRIS